RLAVDLSERLVDVVAFKGGLLAPLRPVDTGVRGEGGLERLALAAIVEILLEPGHSTVITEVTAALVEDLDADLEQRISLILSDQGRLLIDIEKQALRRDRSGLPQRSNEHRIIGLTEESLAHLLAG